MARRLKQNFNEVQAILDAVDHKVDKVEGKNLSTNDYTDEDKAKLSSVEEGAEPNVQGDWDQADTTSDDYIKNKPDLSVKADLPLEDVDIPGLTVRNGYITASGVWNSGNVYCHTLLPVSAGKAVRVTAAESNLFRYAWLTSGRAPRGGIAADLVPGTERTDVAAGSSVSLAVPDGAKYLYVYLGTPAAKANTPESMAVSDTIASLRKDTDTNAGDIAVLGEEARHSGVYGHFDGAGTSVSDGGNIYVVAGMSYRLTMLHPDITVTDPTGNVWRLVVSARDDSGAVVSNLVQVSDVSRLSDHYDLTIPAGATRLYIYGRCAAGQTCDYVLERLDTQTYNDGDILTLNPDSEFLTKWQSAMKPYYTSQSTNKPNCVRFLHLSDVHGNWANVRRFLKFYNHWVDKGYDITAINTGDTATDYLTDGVTGYTSINGVDKILGVVGNHDTRGAQGWQQYKGQEVYNALFAPLISGWGVVQPEGAAENGYCYYHKDYASNKLRLVVVDIMGYDDTEDAWLASVLASAKTAGYHVLIATHFAGGRSSAEASQPPYKKIDCQWSTMAGLASDSTQLNGYNSESYKMADTVHAFMEDGGIFCGYMCGHSHLEFVARLDKYPDQMIYTIGSSKSGKVHDYTHTTGTRMQDEFQIVAVDTDSKFVKLYKVGANYDRRGRHKDSICVSYDTHEVVGFPVTTEALAKEMSGKQDTLVSGTNIKTINGFPILGGGNLQLPGPVQSDWNEDDDGDEAYIKNKPTDIVKYTEQELTDVQKSQARTNIAAASESEVSQLRSEVEYVVESHPATRIKQADFSISGIYKSTDSTISSNVNYYSTALIQVTPGDVIKWVDFPTMNDASFVLCCYDAQESPVSQGPNNRVTFGYIKQTLKFTVPSGVYKVGFTWNTGKYPLTSASVAQIGEDSIAITDDAIQEISEKLGIDTFTSDSSAKYYLKGNSNLVYPPSKKLGVIAAGQSNIDGRNSYSDLPAGFVNPNANVHFCNNTSGTFSDFQVTDGGANNDWSFDAIVYDLLTKSAYGNQSEIYVMKKSMGGTSIDPLGTSEYHWTADYEFLDNPSHSLLRDFEAIIRKAVELQGPNFDIKAMLWHQGEGDTHDEAVANRYYSNLKNMLAYVRGVVGNPRLYVFCGNISLNRTSPYVSIINAAYTKLASEDPYFKVVDMSNAQLEDGYHFNYQWSIYFGQKVYDLMIDAGIISGTKINPSEPS